MPIDLHSRNVVMGCSAAGWLHPIAASAQLAAACTAARHGAGQLAVLPRRPWPAHIGSRQRHEQRSEAGCRARVPKSRKGMDRCSSKAQQSPQLVVSEAADAEAGPVGGGVRQHTKRCGSASAHEASSTASSNRQCTEPDNIQWPGMQLPLLMATCDPSVSSH